MEKGLLQGEHFFLKAGKKIIIAQPNVVCDTITIKNMKFNLETGKLNFKDNYTAIFGVFSDGDLIEGTVWIKSSIGKCNKIVIEDSDICEERTYINHNRIRFMDNKKKCSVIMDNEKGSWRGLFKSREETLVSDDVDMKLELKNEIFPYHNLFTLSLPTSLSISVNSHIDGIVYDVFNKEIDNGIFVVDKGFKKIESQ